MDKDQPTLAFAADIPSQPEMDERQRILADIQEEITRGADFDIADVLDESESLLELRKLRSILVGLRQVPKGKVMTAGAMHRQRSCSWQEALLPKGRRMSGNGPVANDE